jgi:hypothetical protein
MLSPMAGFSEDAASQTDSATVWSRTGSRVHVQQILTQNLRIPHSRKIYKMRLEITMSLLL